MKNLSRLLLCAGVALACQHALAGDVEIHGFANQNVLHSPDLPYKDASPERLSFDETAAALLLTAALADNSKAWTQLHMTREEVRLDWAFVDYRFNAVALGRIGRIKLPVGLYNEIIDAKFLQVTTEAPFLYQEAMDMTSESYQGLGVSLDLPFGDKRAEVELYGGQVPSEGGSERRSNSLLGARVTLPMPLEGLRLMGSAYINELTDPAVQADGAKFKQTTAILSADYKTDRWDVKAEYGLSKMGGNKRTAWYVQAAYALNDTWQPYARYDNMVANADLGSDPAYHQKSFVLGLNYTLLTNLSLRAEHHFNRGYGMAVASEALAAGEGRSSWGFTTASVNFIF